MTSNIDDLDIRDLLNDLSEFLDNQADADFNGERYIPNRAMSLKIAVDEAFDKFSAVFGVQV